MFELLQVFPAHEGFALDHDSPQQGSAPAADPWLAQVLDQIDHGLLTVDEEGQVLHANRVALAELADPEHALQLLGSELRARYTPDAAKLQSALADSRTKGLRRLLALGGGHAPVSVAVVPLPVPSDAARAWRGSRHATLLMLGKRRSGTSLATYWFARAHSLTGAEDLVLQALCRGLSPRDIARANGVALSTVRTQLASIRAKTESGSLRDLMRRIAHLPPIAPAIPAVH